MTQAKHNFDVAVVGASVAGCTAARLYAMQGLSVALIEKHSDFHAYKRLCGHYIQSSATPTIRRLGLAERIEAAGGVRNSVDLWTRWGWIAPRHPSGAEPFGYSIRRSKLDPMIRRLAVETDGVTYIGGAAVTEVHETGGDGAGISVRDQAGAERRIRAGLLVGADGRNSAVAKLAGARSRQRPNERFCYMAYYRGIRWREDRRSWFWALDPDVVIASPNDDEVTLVALFPHKRQLERFRADREAAFDELVCSIPDDPGLADAERVSKFVGFTDYSVIERDPVPGEHVALIGDAALTADPLMAIGCGWAFQSAEWLVDSTAPALAGDEALARGLRRYRWQRRQIAGHLRMLNATARGRKLNPFERLMFSAAARDQVTARRFEDLASRRMPVRRFLSPRAVLRAAWVNGASS